MASGDKRKKLKDWGRSNRQVFQAWPILGRYNDPLLVLLYVPMLNSYLSPRLSDDPTPLTLDRLNKILLQLTFDQVPLVAKTRNIWPEHLSSIGKGRAAALITVLFRMAIRDVDALVFDALEREDISARGAVPPDEERTLAADEDLVCGLGEVGPVRRVVEFV